MDLLLMLGLILILYFFMIRPENKRKKAAEELRNSLKKGERIVTIGGLIGKIVQVNEESVVMETSEDRVRIEIAKWGVQTSETMEAAAAQKGKKPVKAEDAKAENKNEKTEKDDKKDFDPEIK